MSPRRKIFPVGSGVSGVNESTPMPGHLLPAPALLWWRNGRWLESGHLRGFVLFRQIIALVDMWKELWGRALHHLASSAWGLDHCCDKSPPSADPSDHSSTFKILWHIPLSFSFLIAVLISQPFACPDLVAPFQVIRGFERGSEVLGTCQIDLL